MAQYKVLIADSSEDFCRILEDQLKSFCSVCSCRTGSRALDLIKEYRPDFLILDLMLPELDGISLLFGITAVGACPGILATSCYVSSYILKAAEDLGVSYLMEKPCSAEKITGILRRLLQAHSAGNTADRYARVSGALLQLGFSAKLRGYAYLREAVILLSRDPEMSILKELYPEVAGMFGVSADDVEHSIRSAAADAWNHRPEEIWNLYFGEEKIRPSNAVLIQGICRSLEGTEETALAEMF